MDGIALDCRLLARGERVGWVAWRRLLRSGDERVMPALLAALGLCRALPEREVVLRQILQFATTNPLGRWLERPELVEPVFRALAAEAVSDLDDYRSRYSLQWHRVLGQFEVLAALVPQMGGGALGAARAVLDGPPLGALTDYVSGQERFTPVRVYGPKIIAGALAVQWGDDHDSARFLRLAQAPTEDPWTRLESALRWQERAGQPVDPSLALALLHPSLGYTELFDTYVERLQRLGPPLVKAAITALADADFSVRARATRALVALGELAKEPVAALLRTAEDWRTQQNAREALAALDRRLLRQVERQREADGRSISLVRPDADATRGLSRSDP